MKLTLIAVYLVTTLSTPTSAICNACFRNICYTRRKVFEANQLSGQIALDRAENVLHLHYKDMKNTDYTAIINLDYDLLKMHTLPISYTFARAIDQLTGEVYFSGDKGIYKYNSLTKRTIPLGHFSKTIWHMQYKDKLYFSEYKKPGLHYIENNRTVCIPALSDYIIDDFIVDKYDDIYFTSDFLVYRLKKGYTNVSLFTTVLYSLLTDKDDNAFFLETPARLLYHMDYPRDILVEYGMFDVGTEVFRMTFDRDDKIIYCDAADDKVYLLYPNYAPCSLTKKVVSKKM